VVINIIVIQIVIDTTPGSGGGGDNDAGGDADNGGGRVTICHKDRNTLTISESGLNGHLGHGDTLGPCGQGGSDDDD
jgi:hypothetical protein